MTKTSSHGGTHASQAITKTLQSANGYLIFNKEGTPIERKPKLSLLPDIEKELRNNLMLYGHKITRGGTKVSITPSPSPARGVGPHGTSRWRQWFGHCVPKCKGLCRPIFEHKTSQTNQKGGSVGYGLEPGAPTGRWFCVFGLKVIAVGMIIHWFFFTRAVSSWWYFQVPSARPRLGGIWIAQGRKTKTHGLACRR